jgi:pilus assembly protein FimV
VGATPAPSGELLEAVQTLRSELAETRSMIEIRDAEIAALQARLSEMESAPAPAPASAEAVAADTPGTPVVAPAAVTPAAEEAPAAPVSEGRPAVVPPAPEPTLLDRATSLLGNLWLWLALALLALIAAAGVILRNRREQERSIEQDLAETGTWGTLDQASGQPAFATAAAGAAGGRIQPRRPARDSEAILVEESEAPAARGAAAAAPAPPQEVQSGEGTDSSTEEDYQYPFEDTIAGEIGINLDQTDPLAEADFHMAYGLYDQAAEIVKKAIEREPERYELRRKLIDICFVWGNASEFLDQAKAIRGLDDEAAAADWAKIAIMGRQICPDEPMFQAGAATNVDFDLGSDSAASAAVPGAGGDDWLDFDVGESEAAPPPLGDTREQPAPGLDALRPDQTAELNLEELGMDLDLGESGEHALQDLAERAPEFFDEGDQFDEERAGSTLRLSDPPAGAEADVEEAEEESDGTLMLDPSKVRRSAEDPTQRGEGWELGEEEPTLSGADGFEAEREESVVVGGGPRENEATITGSGFFEEDDESDRTLIRRVEPSAEAPTMEVGGFEDDDDASLDLDDLTEALKMDVDLAAEEDELSAGDGEVESTRLTKALEQEPEEPVALGDTAEMPPSEMDEIGTKLDLARAYIDMGDPDGARSILDEVVEEGDEGQRGEARQLLDTLA